MTITDREYAKTPISIAPQGGNAVVHARQSWTAFRPASPDPRVPFDPREAGRRAVRRHGEALRRLAD